MAGKARKYHMHTDASLRFERGVDPNIQAIAVNMASHLLLSICNGDAGPLKDIKNKKFLPKEITIKLNEIRVNKILGHVISKNKITKILKSLNFKVTEAKTSWKVTIPSYRFDVKIEDDLIEEIARVYGFDNIPGATEYSNNPLSKPIDDRIDINNISNLLCSRDYQEIISYSFVDEKIDNFISGKNSSLKLKNPISNEMSVMRSSLLSGLLSALKRNISRQNSRVRLFEVGKVFNGKLNGHDEREKFAVISAGTIDEENWRANNDSIDFYNIKGDLESIIDSNHENHLFSFNRSNNHIFHPGQAAEVFKKGNSIGHVGKLHPNLTKLFNIKRDVFYFEIDYELCFTPFIVNAHTISKYPQIRRDISITIDKSVAASEIINTVIQINPNIIQSTNVFDVYEGKNIEEGRKSIALGLILQDKSRTLIDKDADELVELVIKSLQNEYSAQLRE
jgi:phenylalanyl-tRNA synthetase beta chain